MSLGEKLGKKFENITFYVQFWRGWSFFKCGAEDKYILVTKFAWTYLSLAEHLFSYSQTDDY